MKAPGRALTLAEVIAANTLRLRLERGWSQEKLAREMSMSRETVRSIERGTGLTVSTLERLTEAFQVGPAELLNRDSDMRVRRNLVSSLLVA